MNDKMITFSTSGMCSYTWNRNRLKNKSKIIAFLKCIKPFTLAMLGYRKVKVSEVKKVYTSMTLAKTVFGKEYETYLCNRKIEVQTNHIDSNNNKTPTSNNNKAPTSNKNEAPTSNNDEAPNTKTMTPKQFKELIDAQNFSNDINYIVNGNFEYNNSNKNWTLPNNITIKGHFCIANDKNITHLPENIIVEGNIFLYRCINLTAIPDCMSKVPKIMAAWGCSSLIKVPETMEAGGSIILSSCTSLTTPPKHIRADGLIDFSKCINLLISPDSIIASDYVSFINCYLLKTLPTKMNINGMFFINNNLLQPKPNGDNIIINNNKH